MIMEPLLSDSRSPGPVFFHHPVLVTLDKDVIRAPHQHQGGRIEHRTVAVIPGVPVDLRAGPANIDHGEQAPGHGQQVYGHPPSAECENALDSASPVGGPTT